MTTSDFLLKRFSKGAPRKVNPPKDRILAYTGSQVTSNTDFRDYFFPTNTPAFNKVSLVSGKNVLIKDQGSTNSCLPHAWCSAIEIARNETVPPLSERYVYFFARKAETIPRLQFPNDNGLQMRTAAKIVAIGVSPELLCPFDEKKINQKPDLFSVGFSKIYRIKTYYRLFDIKDVKSAISSGRPVVVGLKINSKFGANKKGIVTNKGDFKFGHAVCFTGYDDYTMNGCFEFINSWGTSFGLAGFGYISYKDFDNALIEAWTADFE